ncbi:MAG: hypothetical protein CR991_03325 [Proteobacteria bacterium]|nr:MAG: hypothetical protein CR991_03325 [Pseudomonadota bacterium]
MTAKTFNCPQCGDALAHHFRFSKLVVCDSCNSTLFLEDEQVRAAGSHSVLTELPSLIQLHQPFQYLQYSYLPVGHIRYSYHYGLWDEWWVIDSSGQGIWISVDEGDFAFEHRQAIKHSANKIPSIQKLKLEQSLELFNQKWWVTEKGLAKCEGFRGELPEIIEWGERFAYAHLSGEHSELLTLEYPLNGKVQAYLGKWVDPFEIKVDT